eukprot:1162059-Pelagomonas_calceolata.AAC.6
MPPPSPPHNVRAHKSCQRRAELFTLRCQPRAGPPPASVTIKPPDPERRLRLWSCPCSPCCCSPNLRSAAVKATGFLAVG